MELWIELFTDPVAIFSAIGMAVMFGIAVFFIWFILSKSATPDE